VVWLSKGGVRGSEWKVFEELLRKERNERNEMEEVAKWSERPNGDGRRRAVRGDVTSTLSTDEVGH
jgi:hypothetical protein